MVINWILAINWLFGLVLLKWGLSYKVITWFLAQIVSLGSGFQFMGLGWFLGGLYLRMITHHQPHQHWETKHICVFQSQSLPDWGVCVSSLVCLCQHARSVPACQRVIPEVSASLDVPEGPRCPEGQDVVPLCQIAQNPQDCTYGTILLEMIFVLFYLSCDGLLAVGIVKRCV